MALAIVGTLSCRDLAWNIILEGRAPLASVAFVGVAEHIILAKGRVPLRTLRRGLCAWVASLRVCVRHGISWVRAPWGAPLWWGILRAVHVVRLPWQPLLSRRSCIIAPQDLSKGATYYISKDICGV